MKITLKDIANEVGVSIATVSIVINDPNTSRISDNTKRQILRTAAEMNYIPNLAARSLASNASHSIGIVVPSVENPFFATLVYNLEKLLNDIGYGLISSSSRNDFDTEIEQIERLVGRGIDGLMVATTAYDEISQEKLSKELDNYHLPIVLLDREVEGTNHVQVVYDNFYGGQIATQYLISKGHKKIGIISAISTSLSGRERFLGYQNALESNELKINSKLVVDGGFDSKYGYKGIEELLANGATAVFAANDLIAYGIMRKCLELGVEIGKDLSIIGYDNLDINEILDTGLTSMMQDIDKLGKVSADLMMSIINKDTVERKIVLKPNIIERESVNNI